MPQLVAAAATAVNSWAAASGFVALTNATAWVAANAALVTTVATVAGSVAYSASQQRKLKKALGSLQGSQTVDQGRTIMLRDPTASWRVIYGECLVSGNIVFWHQGGNGYHYMVVVLAARECEELGEIRFNGEVVPLDGSGNATGAYAGYAQVRKFTGLAAGERDTTWESEISSKWTSAHVGKNIARLHIRLKWSSEIFPEGIPAVTCKVKGAKVYDPREGSHDPDDPSTWAYSTNSALCTADLLHDARFGKGVAWSRIREAELIEAANICEEQILLADGVTYENRYDANGTYLTSQDPLEGVLDLAGSMAGHVCDAGGLWTIRAGAWRTPVLTLGDGDMAGSFSCVPRASRQDTYNGVRGTYISETNDWAAADFPAVKNDTYMGWDGDVRLWKDIALPYTTSPAMAQRLAKIDLEVGRQQIIVTGDYMLKAMQCQPGDVIMLTRARLGWSDKYFEVTSWQLKLIQAGDGLGLVVALGLRETAEGVYDWNDGEETTVDLAPNTDLTDARTVATPTSLALDSASYTVIQPDGTVIPKIRASWDASTDQQVLSGGHVWVEYKQHSSGTWLVWSSSLDGSATEDYLTDVKAGVAYDVRVRFENVNGVKGAAASVTNHVVAGDTTAPAAPGTGTATASLEAITVDWPDNTEDDLDHYEVWRHTSNSSGSASKVADVRASRFVDTLVTAGTTYYYWKKAVDRSGNVSGFSSEVHAAPNAQAGGGAEVNNAGGSPTAVLGNSSYTSLVSLNKDVNGGAATIRIVYSLQNNSLVISDLIDLRVKRAGSTIYSVSIPVAPAGSVSDAIDFTDTPGAGNYTYEVEAKGDDPSSNVTAQVEITIIG